jgi:hypothetical protein
MEYKVGDKVRIRKDLQVRHYAGRAASCGMTAYAGDEVTIRTRSGDSRGKYYTIEEDSGVYAWTEAMFEGFEKNEIVDEQSSNNSGSDAIKPDYYQFHGYDVFDIAEHFGLSFPLGNALKYILRHKDETKRLEDLKKARQCLDRAIELMEKR